MMKYKLKSGPPLDANGYHFEKGVSVEVTDEATLRKLKTHPCFEKVDD